MGLCFRRALLPFCLILVVTASEWSSAQTPFTQSHSMMSPITQTSPAGYQNQPASNPIAALEAKVNELQHQLYSLHANTISDTCDSYCNNNQTAGFYGGAGAVFAKPHFKEAFQYSQTNIATGTQTLIPFEYEYESTLRAWAGYRTQSGFGLEATFWEFDGDGRTNSNTADGTNIYGAHAVTIIFPANIFAQVPGEQLVNSDSLNTQILKYYGTYKTQVGRFEVNGGMGLCHAELEQNLNSIVFDAGGAPIRQLNWQREYDGLGPSATVNVKRQIGCSPLSIVARGGGSLLFGTKTINRTVLGDQSPQPASPFLSLEEADEVVGIGEVELGFEWSRPIRCGQLNVRGTYEGQLWAEGGAPTLGFLGFEGFGIQVGLTR